MRKKDAEAVNARMQEQFRPFAASDYGGGQIATLSTGEYDEVVVDYIGDSDGDGVYVNNWNDVPARLRRAADDRFTKRHGRRYCDSGKGGAAIELIKVMKSDDALRIPTLDGKRLMLVTCYPFYYTGHAPEKYVVLSRMLDDSIF